MFLHQERLPGNNDLALESPLPGLERSGDMISLYASAHPCRLETALKKCRRAPNSIRALSSGQGDKRKKFRHGVQAPQFIRITLSNSKRGRALIVIARRSEFEPAASHTISSLPQAFYFSGIMRLYVKIYTHRGNAKGVRYGRKKNVGRTHRAFAV